MASAPSVRAKSGPVTACFGDCLLLVHTTYVDFDAKALGFTLVQMQALLHARIGDGSWVTGLDITQWSRRAVGLEAWADH